MKIWKDWEGMSLTSCYYCKKKRKISKLETDWEGMGPPPHGNLLVLHSDPLLTNPLDNGAKKKLVL